MVALGTRQVAIGRRQFISAIGGATVAWPLAARAQQPAMPKRHVGALLAYPENDPLGQAAATAFAKALEHFGWIEGRNIAIEYRWAAGDPILYKTYAAELVGLSPDAILAGASPAVEALRALTRSIPIVFVLTVDPVGLGFVQSLARPGGNITGFSNYDAPLMGKWLGMLKEVAPGIMRVAVIFNPDTAPFATLFNRAIEAAAPSFGVTITLAPVHNDTEIEEAIAAHARQPAGGLIILPESFSLTHRGAIIAAANRYKLPTIGMGDILPKGGGLMSYWINIVDTHAEAASYIDRILKGAAPADLPVVEPTKFELVINLKTAKVLGLTVPQSLLATADEVIE
jgi:putative ABC transport system substrate-binding protein